MCVVPGGSRLQRRAGSRSVGEGLQRRRHQAGLKGVFIVARVVLLDSLGRKLF